jgi:hypothetical protein
MNYEKIYIYIFPSINMLNTSYSLLTLINMLNKNYFFLKINRKNREGKKNFKNRERKGFFNILIQILIFTIG